MSYSQFTTIGKVKEAFGIITIEGDRFFPTIPSIAPSQTLTNYLAESVPLAVAVSSDKVRSENIIAPILIEVRRLLQRRISLFSGEELNVDESLGLNGVCDFLISGSPEQMEIEAPVIVLVEAKKGEFILQPIQMVSQPIITKY